MTFRVGSSSTSTNIDDLSITGLCQDSRSVKPGDLFFALSGFTVDGRKFIPAAIEKGARAILIEAVSDRDVLDLNDQNASGLNVTAANVTSTKVPIIPFADLKNAMGFISDIFYSKPSEAIDVIGITGTNGKTSCSHFIAQLMTNLGSRCGIMGTLGAGLQEKLKNIDSTTADAITTHRELAELYKMGAVAAAIEVTSHGLTQGRVNGVKFHTAIFTNLTRDHLDYHENMDSYFAAKKRLFLDFKPKYKILNLDDEYGRLLWQELNTLDISDGVNGVIGYKIHKDATDDPSHILYTEDLILDENGMKASLHTPWGVGKFHCNLLGEFNVSNILAAVAALLVQGFALEPVLKAISTLQSVNGRMLRLGGISNLPMVVVDFAHTPDALAKVLQSVKQHCTGKLWCIFGCGGD